MLVDNEMTLHFLSNSSNEGFVRATVAAFALQLDPTFDELSDIKTALSEGVTNAIIHGYDNIPTKTVTVKCEVIKNKIIITIEDKGKGIKDIEKARRLFFSESTDSERSGMGFTVMESFMDSLEVHSQLDVGTKIIMSKTIGNAMDAQEIWYEGKYI